jgi:hypothetical protein
MPGASETARGTLRLAPRADCMTQRTGQRDRRSDRSRRTPRGRVSLRPEGSHRTPVRRLSANWRRRAGPPGSRLVPPGPSRGRAGGRQKNWRMGQSWDPERGARHTEHRTSSPGGPPADTGGISCALPTRRARLRSANGSVGAWQGPLEGSRQVECPPSGQPSQQEAAAVHHLCPSPMSCRACLNSAAIRASRSCRWMRHRRVRHRGEHTDLAASRGFPHPGQGGFYGVAHTYALGGHVGASRGDFMGLLDGLPTVSDGRLVHHDGAIRRASRTTGARAG